MSKEQNILVMDFDGTVTNLHTKQETYIDPYVNELSTRIEMNGSELTELMAQARQEVIKNPEQFFWLYNGVITSAATDVILITQASMIKVTDKLREQKGLKIPPKEQMQDFMEILHRAGRKELKFDWQKGVEEFIDKAREQSEIVIVTNSETEDVNRELSSLMGSEHGIALIGGAKKYVIDPGWQGVSQASTRPFNYPHPVSLLRPYYYDTLTGLDLSKIKLVIGDMSELDLFLPQFLGIPTALKQSATTPYWENEHYGIKTKVAKTNRYLIKDFSRGGEVLTEVLEK